jgi:N-acetylglucosaminyldiphosphoundecaprenol N-acetyl-beta-D-mannosaminyltransferase
MDLVIGSAFSPSGPNSLHPADPRRPRLQAQASSESTELDEPEDLSREVFGILGIPLDAVNLTALLARMDRAAAARKRFLLSTPNVNFLILSQTDPEFRESLLLSDCCPVDGMPIVWIARLMGIPISRRVSGTDIFDALRWQRRDEKLKVFLFGGAEDLAKRVGESINREEGGVTCVGALNPGFGSISNLSTDPIITGINESGADFLTVFLSARKAQAFLLQNHERLEIPIRAQLGATINVQAGVVRRAPKFLQRMGLEWLWRVKEEPHLWRRYLHDGRRLLYLTLSCVLPLSAYHLYRALRRKSQCEGLTVEYSQRSDAFGLELVGAATAKHIDHATAAFRQALKAESDIVINLSRMSSIDARFFGLLLMLRKQQLGRGRRLSLVAATRETARLFQMNRFGFLLS